MFSIDEFVKWFEEQERIKRKEALSFRDKLELPKEIKEVPLVHKINPIDFSLKIGAVDSGLQHRSYLGLDIILCRPAGVIFTYENSHLKHAEYINKYSQPDQLIEKELDEREILWAKSLFRLKKEITTAIQMIDKADMLILDGSLLPLTIDRPTEDSELFLEYKHLTHLYSQLFSLAKQKDVLLLGISKDTRSKRLTHLLGINGSDAMFAERLLNINERTSYFSYGNSLISKEIAYAKEINVFYLKAGNDAPLRVEFLSNKSIDYISGIIYSLSSINPNYSYPAILIEVDLRAMIPDLEIDKIEKTIALRMGKTLKSLRKNNRPFR